MARDTGFPEAMCHLRHTIVQVIANTIVHPPLPKGSASSPMIGCLAGCRERRLIHDEYYARRRRPS